jgi:hypothetical protein
MWRAFLCRLLGHQWTEARFWERRCQRCAAHQYMNGLMEWRPIKEMPR